MAIQALKITLGPARANGDYAAQGASTSQPSNASTAATETAVATAQASSPPSQTATEAAVALLEADGATPTQAHVNSLRTVWNTLVTAIGTVNTDVEAVRTAFDALVTAAGLLTAAPTGNLVILYDDAVITDGNKFAAALREALNAARSRGLIIAQG